MQDYIKKMGVKDIAKQIYDVFVHKKFRAGSLPNEQTKELVLDKIVNKLIENSPIEIFQFWGGSKNPNLHIEEADLCEKAALNNLKRLNDEIVKIYCHGLKIFIFPGDERIHRTNKIPWEHTQKYVRSLVEMVNGYDGLFEVVPVSVLYRLYAEDFGLQLKEAQQQINSDIFSHVDFKRLQSNAAKNIYTFDLTSEKDITSRSKNAARDYIVYRVAEERAEIFRDYRDCIRFSFIKFSPFFNIYKDYIPGICRIQPGLNCVLYLYTGNKGNISQPWQAIGVEHDNKVIFLSQKKMK